MNIIQPRGGGQIPLGGHFLSIVETEQWDWESKPMSTQRWQIQWMSNILCEN